MRILIRCVGLLVASYVLVACGLVSGDAPTNYAQPYDLIDPYALQGLLGLETVDLRDFSGGGASGDTTTATLSLSDGRWAHAEMLYVDQALSELVNPPSGADLRGRIEEVPVSGESRTVTLVERPPTVLDETFGCVRVVVSTRDFQTVDQARKQQFVESIEIGLSQWLAELPEDPCEARPPSPPGAPTPSAAGATSSS